MDIISLDFPTSNKSKIEHIKATLIPEEYKEIFSCFPSMDKKLYLGKIFDFANISVGESDTVDCVCDTEPLYLGEFRFGPMTEEHSPEGRHFRVRGTFVSDQIELSVTSILEDYNVLILNSTVSNTYRSGFLLFTLGDVQSDADVKISEKNLSDGHLTIPINILSGVIA